MHVPLIIQIIRLRFTSILQLLPNRPITNNMKLIIATSLLLVASDVSAFASFTQKTTLQRTTALQNDLWGQPPEKDGQVKEMSKALPFVPRPKLLDGTLAGDVGFEYVIMLPFI